MERVEEVVRAPRRAFWDREFPPMNADPDCEKTGGRAAKVARDGTFVNSRPKLLDSANGYYLSARKK